MGSLSRISYSAAAFLNVVSESLKQNVWNIGNPAEVKLVSLFNVKKCATAVCRMNYKKFQARLLFEGWKLF